RCRFHLFLIRRRLRMVLGFDFAMSLSLLARGLSDLDRPSSSLTRAAIASAAIAGGGNRCRRPAGSVASLAIAPAPNGGRPLPPAVAEEVRDLLALHLVSGLGPRLTAALLEHFDSARAVLEAPPDLLRQVPYIGAKLAAAVSDATLPAQVEAE